VLAAGAVQPATLARADHPFAALDPATYAAPAQARPSPIVRQAFDLLMDRFVVPPSSDTLLNAGLDGAERFFAAKGLGHALAARPEWTGDRGSDWQLFLGAYDTLAQKAEGAIPLVDLDRVIVSGMAESFREAHTHYLPPDVHRMMQEQLRDRVQYTGIGIQLNSERVVTDVFEDGPADRAGMRRGDEIVAVDGVGLEASNPQETSVKLRGDEGTSVRLGIRRGEGTPPIELSLTRAPVSIAWVRARILDGNVGYLQIRTFPIPDSQVLPLFRQAMQRFKDVGVGAIVIDVRGNSGGSVTTGESILSEFLPDNTAVYRQVSRRGTERVGTTWGGNGTGRDMPIAVLADSASGSMSEILASALQENAGAKVFGTKTAGAVAASNVFPLTDGSGLSVTILTITTGKGRVLNEIGLEPDSVVELDAEQLRRGRDNQLDAALSYVRQKVSARSTGEPAPAAAR